MRSSTQGKNKSQKHHGCSAARELPCARANPSFGRMPAAVSESDIWLSKTMISRYTELRSFTAQQGFASSLEWDELSADEGLKEAQSVMAKAYHKAEAAEVRRLANAVEHSRAVNVRLEGLQSPKGIGAGAWLLDAGFRSLVSSEFVVALRRRGFVTFPELRSCPHCSGCGAHADAFGDHAETCPALAKHATTVHNYVRDVLYALARSLGLEPGWETPGLVEGTAERPADVLIPSHRSHGLGREPAHAALDACIDVSGVCSLCDSYVREPVLQPLYERCQLKMRRVMPAGLFVAPLVFSSTGVFLERSLRPLLTRFAVALREEHPAKCTWGVYPLYRSPRGTNWPEGPRGNERSIVTASPPATSGLKGVA